MELVFLPIFLVSDSFRVKIEWVVHELALWIDSAWELLGHRDGVVNILLPGVTGLPVAQQPELRVVLLSSGLILVF